MSNRPFSPLFALSVLLTLSPVILIAGTDDFFEVDAGSDTGPGVIFGNSCYASNGIVVNAGSDGIFIHERVFDALSRESFWERSVPVIDFSADSVAICDDGSRFVAGKSFTRTSVFDWVVSSWVETPIGVSFGHKVAISGDCNTIAVGSLGTDTANVYRYIGETWSEIDSVTGSTAIALSEDGDTVFSASWLTQTAYVSYLTGGFWTVILGPLGSGTFGFALDVLPGGTSFTVGDPEWTNDSGDRVGACFVFLRATTGNIWTPSMTLVASDGEVDDRFCHSLGISGLGETFVGSPFSSFECPGAGCNTGSVYRFSEDGIETDKIVSPSESSNNHFGWCVSAGGGTTLLSEPGHDGDTVDEGRSFISTTTSPVIFADGFESGDTNSWSNTTP